MSKRGGLDLLIEQAEERARDMCNDHYDDVGRMRVVESPIERLLLTALCVMVNVGSSEYQSISIPDQHLSLTQILTREDPLTLVVVPQVDVAGWRADFLVHAWDFGRIHGKAQWRRLVVECDGHDFHERTKEQAKRDRSRDRAAQLRGISILRFTGSEIHNDPLGCAQQISEWGTMGW